MILAIHNQNVASQGVMYRIDDVFVQVSEGTTLAQALALFEAQQTEEASSAVKARIEALERTQLLPRATREFMLMFMEANAGQEILSANYGYQAVKAFDLQIAALRAQL